MGFEPSNTIISLLQQYNIPSRACPPAAEDGLGTLAMSVLGDWIRDRLDPAVYAGGEADDRRLWV
ncbi:MAG: hypothetical protein P8X90_34950 [Desulfobacterales bacterium]